MNADKKSFMFYASWFASIETLDESTQIQLFKAIMRYAFFGELPNLNPMLMFGFHEIKAQIDRDNSKWEDKREKRRQAGRLGAQKTNEMRWGSQQMSANVGKSQQKSTKSPVDVDADVDVDVDVDADVDVHKVCVCNNNIKHAPTIDMCIDYAESKGYTKAQAEKFFYFQDGVGWNEVNNWKSKLTYWCKKDESLPANKSKDKESTIQKEYEQNQRRIQSNKAGKSLPQDASKDFQNWLNSNGYTEVNADVIKKYRQYCQSNN